MTMISFFDQSVFFVKLQTLGISFSTVTRAVVVTQLLIPGILALTSFILALIVVLVAKLVISGLLSSIFFILALFSVFLTTSFFITLLSLHKSTGTVSNFPISNLSTLFFYLLKSLGAVFNLSTSILSTSAFKLTKSDFTANLDGSITIAFFKSAFVA